MSQARLGVQLLVCALVLLPSGAPAQDFSAKPIRIIVPNPPGGTGDLVARFVGQKLGESFHQPGVIENQAGASGTIGMNIVRRAAPDGHTIGLVISLAQTVERIQNKAAPFDLTKDFTPITALVNNPVVLLVNSNVKATNLAELIEDARRRPGEVSYSSPGIGTAHHLYGEMLNKVAGISMINVPYRGVAPALNDVLAGHVPVGIVSLSAALQHLATGTVRALVLFDARRHPKLPDVPIISEVLPGYDLASSWVGFVGPPDLQAAILARLHQEIVRILNSTDGQRVFGENGLDAIGNTPEEFAAMIRRDAKLWDEAATIAGLTAQ